MDKNAFLDDTNLSSLHISEPRATSTLLPDQRHRRSRPVCGDVAKKLFHGTSGDDSSLGILASNEYRDCSFLSTSVRPSTAEQAMAEEMSSENDPSWYLRERFGVSMDDLEAQAMLGFEETFTDAAAQIIEQDEKQFNKEHLLDAFEEPSSMRSCGSAQFGEITRPSWMSSSGDDRITVSAYLRSKSAPMDKVLGFSKAPPLLEEPKKESAPDKMSIRDLVEQQLGLTMSTYKKQCNDESRETSQTSLHSEFSMEDSLGDAASRWSKGPVNKQTSASRLGHAAPSQWDSQTDRKAHGDCHFKRPQGTAPRARVPRTPTASPSSSTLHSSSSGLGSASTLTASRIPPRVLSSRKQDGSHLPIRSKASHLISGKRNVSSLKSPSRLLRKVSPIVPKSSHGARSINGDFGSRQHSGDLEFQLAGGGQELSLSSPDLRMLKNRGSDKQPLVLKSMCRSDDNLVPERDDTTKEGRLPARELFGSSRKSPKNPTGEPSDTAGSIQGSSHGPVFSNSESLPAPSGLVLPVSFLQHSRADLGTFCANAPQNVVLALVNPTAKSQCYQIQQLRSTIDGRAPKHTETVIVLFPGQHPVAGGCVTEVQGSFLSMSPGFVEIIVGIFTVDKAGSDYESLHSMTLAAQVEQPCIALEPSQSITFEGLHFDAEQGSANSSSSREVNVINKSSCAVPVVVCIRGGEGVFTVRAKEVDGIKDHVTTASLSVVLPSKKERAVTSFVVDCSTHRADCLTVEAKMEVFFDGSLLSRRVLAGVGLRASIEPPSLTLEHVSTCKPLEVCCGRGRATSVWLKNSGPCPLDLELSAGALFNVSPGRFRIQAADHMELLISAAETAGRIGTRGIDGRCEGVLEAAVMPQGFKVALISLVGSSDQHAASDATALAGASKRGASRDNKKFMTLESNRKFLLWAQVHNLASEERSLKIRNPNSNPINVEVSVSKPYHKVFQVKLQGGDSTSASPSLCLDGNGSVDIHVVNGNSSSLVTGASFIESRLVIRSYSGSYTDVNNVALYAFGGALKVELHDTLCLGRTRHLVDMGMPLAPGTVSSNSFTLVNNGDWDAFVYLAVPGSILDPSKESSDKAGRGTVSVAPSCFVLHRKKCKTVSLTYKFGATDAQMCAGGQVVTLSVIRVLFGFEALRQAAKRVFSKPTGCKRQPSELMSLFLGSFENEGKVDDVTVSAGVVEEVFTKTASQVAVAVIASGGATTELIQSCTAASFAPLEDLSFLSRLSLSELPE